MPENPEKKLGGYVVETRSSDGAIIRTIEGLRQEISGVVGETSDAIEADVLSPKNIGLFTEHDSTESNTALTRNPDAKINPTNSATGLHLLIERNLKKTA